MSSSIPVWELKGLSESDDYDEHPITPAWKINKMSWNDWEETLKSKVHTTIIEAPREEKQPEWPLQKKL